MIDCGCVCEWLRGRAGGRGLVEVGEDIGGLCFPEGSPFVGSAQELVPRVDKLCRMADPEDDDDDSTAAPSGCIGHCP